MKKSIEIALSEGFLARLTEPKPLTYYERMAAKGAISVELDALEQAVIMKAHDRGIEALSSSEMKVINLAVSTVNQAIRAAS